MGFQKKSRDSCLFQVFKNGGKMEVQKVACQPVRNEVGISNTLLGGRLSFEYHKERNPVKLRKATSFAVMRTRPRSVFR